MSLAGLVDALDRLIDTGAAVAGDIVIGGGDVDLIRLDLRALITAVSDTSVYNTSVYNTSVYNTPVSNTDARSERDGQQRR